MKRHTAGAAWVALAVFAGGPVAAGLAEEAPKGVDLSGTWLIDASASDDPRVALASVKRSLEAQKPRARGRYARQSAGRGGEGGPEDESGERLFRELAQDAERQQRAQQLEQLAEILRNPPHLEIQQRAEAVHFVADYDRLECVPGELVSVTDTSGTGRRTCGWSGAALLVQLKQKIGMLVERRYELTTAGSELLYTTTLSGDKLTPVKLRRLYRRGSITAPPSVASPAH